MPWAKFDDRRHENPKLRQAGLECDGLDARAITYCAGQLTDGFVPTASVQMLAGVTRWRRLAKKLEEVGRWDRDDDRDGWWVHDYLEYNPSKADIEADRQAKRQRAVSGARARWGDRVAPDASSMPEACHELGSSMLDGIAAEMPPTRTRPVPVQEPLGATPGGVGEFASQRGGRDRASEVASRLAGVCKGRDRAYVDREASDVVAWASTKLDLRVVDEVVGDAERSPHPPTLPRALAPALRQRASDARCPLPPFEPPAAKKQSRAEHSTSTMSSLVDEINRYRAMNGADPLAESAYEPPNKGSTNLNGNHRG